MNRKRGKKVKRSLKSPGFFKTNYSRCWNYICESRNFIFIAILFFVLGIVLSLFYQPSWAVEWAREFIHRILSQTSGMDQGQLTLFILGNNLKNSFISIIGGIFYSLYPIFVGLVNGYLLGFVSSLSIDNAGISELWKLIPHGIFEFPAIFISFGLGIRLGSFWFQAGNKRKDIFAFLLSIVIFFVLLLLFSAILSFIFIEPACLGNVSEKCVKQIQNNGLFHFVYLFGLFILFLLSNFIASFTFSKKEKSAIYSRLAYLAENSFLVFVFVVLPLLIIAAVIEALLIVSLS